MTLQGRCHCGNVMLEFESASPPVTLEVRACGCSFCRRHGARATSDPKGRVAITVQAPDQLLRYRFGLRTADFLVCARCGIYVAAVMAEEGASYATVNVNVLAASDEFGPATPVVYEGETEAERRARRRARWSPATVAVR